MKSKPLSLMIVVLITLFASQGWGMDRGIIASGHTLTDYTIVAPDYKDRFHFNGKIGQHVLFTAVTTQGSLDTLISLYAPSGTLEKNTYNSGQLRGDDKLDWTLKEAGTYTVVVEDKGLNDPGVYNYSFLLLPPGPLTYAGDLDGGAMVSGETHSAKMNAASDLDAYQFSGQTGQHVLFTAVTTQGSLDTLISLYAPSGTLEKNTYNSGQLRGDDKLDWTLKEAGTYTVVVEDKGLNDPGVYNYSFLLLPPDR